MSEAKDEYYNGKFLTSSGCLDEDRYKYICQEYIKELEDKIKTVKEDIEGKIQDMTDGVCEHLRMESQGPAINDNLWIAYEKLSEDLDEILEFLE